MAEPGDTVPQSDLSGHPSVPAVLSTLAAHHVRTTVRYLPDAVEVEVTDTGNGGRASRPSTGDEDDRGRGSGLGHVGMRERVAAVGGTVEIGPRARGGYLVRAWLPTS